MTDSIPATSSAPADLQAAINAARAGDTVRLPAGTATWTNGLALSKGIHLEGDGAGGLVGHSRTRLAIGGSGTLGCAENGVGLCCSSVTARCGEGVVTHYARGVVAPALALGFQPIDLRQVGPRIKTGPKPE